MDTTSKDYYGRTSFHYACQNGQIEVLKILLHSCFYYDFLHLKSTCGWTCLHAASASGNVDLVEYLVYSREADPFLEDDAGATPLTIAKYCRHSKVVAFLSE